MIEIGKRYRTKDPLNVLCWWWLDTIAILDDYSDGGEAILAAGECFKIVEIPTEEPHRILCEPDNPKPLKKQALPPFCQTLTFKLGGRIVDFRIEVADDDIEKRCESIDD